jgi:hypothetical protein
MDYMREDAFGEQVMSLLGQTEVIVDEILLSPNRFDGVWNA